MLLSFFFSIVLLTVQSTSASVCRSVRINNRVESLRRLENCTVVEGFVKVILMQLTNLSHFESISFPRLREITEYLLVYDVTGLRSIGKLFPNLERIGGEVLFSQDSALVIVKVLHMEEIGLSSLREISRGSVAIRNNPSETRWQSILLGLYNI